MIRPRCPDPEMIARLLEQRLGRTGRRRILDHAADCPSCRRQLAVGSLTSIGPIRAVLFPVLASGWLSAAAAVALLLIVLWGAESLSHREPDRHPVARRTASPRRISAAPPAGLGEGAPAFGAPEEREEAPSVSDPPPPAESVQEGPSVAAAPHPLAPREAPPTAPTRPRESSVVELPRTPGPAAEPETLGRVAILDPFGSLALEGAAGRTALQNTCVVPVDARLTTTGRSSGFRLADGTRLQLAPGCSISVYQNSTRRCPGLTLHQGALLIESSRPQSLVLRRDKATGTLEGFAGQLHLSAGSRPDALSISSLGSPAVWRRQGQPAIDLAAGDLLSVEGEGQELARRGSRPKPSLARFVTWPEQSTTLFYASFEPDVEAGERPVLVEGTSREGYVSAVAGAQKRKEIELSLPSGILSSSDVVIRLKCRTTGARIQCSSGSRDSRGGLQAIPGRNRSETAWMTINIPFPAGDPDGHAGGRGRRNGRSLTIWVEPPARMAPEELVFDLDEIEILRS